MISVTSILYASLGLAPPETALADFCIPVQFLHAVQFGIQSSGILSIWPWPIVHCMTCLEGLYPWGVLFHCFKFSSLGTPAILFFTYSTKVLQATSSLWHWISNLKKLINELVCWECGQPDSSKQAVICLKTSIAQQLWQTNMTHFIQQNLNV